KLKYNFNSENAPTGRLSTVTLITRASGDESTAPSTNHAGLVSSFMSANAGHATNKSTSEIFMAASIRTNPVSVKADSRAEHNRPAILVPQISRQLRVESGMPIHKGDVAAVTPVI